MDVALVACAFWRAAISRNRANAAEVPGQRFGLHFLHQVGLGIGAQVVLRAVAGEDHRQRAVRQRLVDVEREIQLGRHQGKHRRGDCPAGKEIDTAPPQLAGARTGEYEAQTLGFDEAMHLVQDLGDPLHLVDDGPRPGRQRGEFPVQGVRGLAQPQRFPGVEQVIRGGGRKTGRGIQVVFPVPRGPNRKTERVGVGSNLAYNTYNSTGK